MEPAVRNTCASTFLLSFFCPWTIIPWITEWMTSSNFRISWMKFILIWFQILVLYKCLGHLAASRYWEKGRKMQFCSFWFFLENDIKPHILLTEQSKWSVSLTFPSLFKIFIYIKNVQYVHETADNISTLFF